MQPSNDERLDTLDAWRAKVERRMELTEVVEYVYQLRELEASDRRRVLRTNGRWRSLQVRAAVCGGFAILALSIYEAIVK